MKLLLVIYFIIIALLVLFLLFKINYQIYFREGLTDGNTIFGNTSGPNTLAVDSTLTMKVKVENTFESKIDPNPNENYTASIDTFGVPAIMSGNNTAVLPYYLSKKILDTSNISLTIQPLTSRTSQNKIHYEDAFPRMFKIDVFVDFSSIPFRLDNNTDSTTVSVDSNGVLNANKIAIILDYSSNHIGYVKKDIYDPTHYFVTITTPTTIIKKVVFTWSLYDLCRNWIPNSFSGNCQFHGNCVPYSFTNFYNNFPGYSYLGNLFSGNMYTGNITFGNCSPGAPSSLCSGSYKVPTIT